MLRKSIQEIEVVLAILRQVSRCMSEDCKAATACAVLHYSTGDVLEDCKAPATVCAVLQFVKVKVTIALKDYSRNYGNVTELRFI